MSNKITYPDKVAILEPGVAINQWQDADANEVKDKHNLNDDRITNVEDNQTVGYLAYSLYADLPATGTVNSSYKVTNDTAALNGYYHWDGSAYIKDTSLYPGTVADGDVDAVEGGVIYDAFIEQETEISGVEFIDGYYIKALNGSNAVSATRKYTDYRNIENSEKIIIRGYTEGSVVALVAYYDEDKVFISAITTGSLVRNEILKSSFPAGAAYIRCSGAGDGEDYLTYSTIDATNKRIEELGVRDKVENEYPIDLDYGALSSSTRFNNNYYDKGYVRSPKYIDMSEVDNFTLNISRACEIRAYYYDADYVITRFDDYTGTVNELIVTKAVGERYCSFLFRDSESLTDMPVFDATVAGVFIDNPERKNVRRSEGYQKLTIQVNVANASASDATTDAVQDVEDIEVDYGYLLLPENYSNEGKPTRIILYCHGAGINYPSTMDTLADFTTIMSGDLNPEYWLAEGYAIMDIEGNPYDNTNEHFYMPQMRQCYLAAYEWVQKNYNVEKEILLGGRSMGGGSVFELLSSTLPIIAACPNVPIMLTLGYWNYCGATRRAFLSDKMGFTGTAPTWTNSDPMTSSEWQYLQDNFDKLVIYSPIWRLISDLPDKATLFEHAQIASNAYDADERAVYEDLHMRVKCPIKIFAVEDDATILYEMGPVLYFEMLRNAAQIVELRTFLTGGHHADIDNSAMRASITTTYGEALTNVPVVYIEMLQFWKRYES